ncbi:hypothetical protein ACFVT9_23120 [Kitasatospora cineracea]|uniref:WXG100-like domain-containing protein n=1 Tax=Kitasatospora cineracea TaxID=88074 RepID=UPI0036DE9830
MAVDDLPAPVVTFLNVIGVPWPYINEDEVREFAAMVRKFGQAVERTHAEATRAMDAFARAYQGAATRRMQSGWSELSERHTRELVLGCTLLAEALEVGAEVIVAQKVEALVELGVMAAAFIADQAAAVATLGLAEAAVPVIVEAGKKLLETLKQQIIQYVIGEIIEAAAKPLFAKIEHAMSGLDWGQTSGGAGAADGFSLDAELADRHLSTMRAHTEAFRGHAQELRGGLERLAF